MGSAAFMMGEFTTAVAQFSAALDLDPTNAIVKQELHKVHDCPGLCYPCPYIY